MARITWTGAAGDGLWNNPINWDRGIVPGDGDDITIDAVGTNIITNVDIRAKQLLLLSGTLTSTAAITWSSDVTVAAGAAVQLIGGIQTFAAGTRFTGEGLVELLNGSTLSISAPIAGDDDDDDDDDGGGDDDDDDTNTDANAVIIENTFQNDGTVEVAAAATLVLAAEGEVGGSFNVAENATVRLSGGTQTLATDINFVGLGAVEVDRDSTLIVDSDLSISIDFDNLGRVVVTAGTLTLAGEVTGDCDRFDIEAGATLLLSGETQRFVNGTRFTGAGLLELAAGSTFIVNPTDIDDGDDDNDAIIIESNFQNDGTVEVAAAATLVLAAGGEIGGSFNITETAKVQLSGGIQTFATDINFVGLGAVEVARESTLIIESDLIVPIGFDNLGSVVITAGTLTLAGEVTGNCDRFDIEAGATLLLSGETQRFVNGTRFTGTGLLELEAGSTFFVNPMDIDDDDDDDDGSGTTDTIVIETALANRGTVEVETGTLVLAGTVSGDCDVFDIAANATVQLSGATQSFTNGTLFTGVGLLQLLSGTFSVSETTTIETKFENRSTVVVETGTLFLAGNTISTGGFNVSAEAAVEISAGTHVFDAGTTFTGAGSIRLTGGTLTVNTPIVVDQLEVRGGTLVGAANITASTITETSNLVVSAGESQIITTNFLQVTAGNIPVEQITYVVTDLPDSGTLLLNGVALTLNATFTQADINNNLLTYVGGDGGAFIDSFGFSVSNGVEIITSSTFDFSFRAIGEFRATGTAGIFGFVETGAIAPLRFTVANSSATLNNEIGVFVVDDDLGTIQGIAPGEVGYLQAALSRAQVISSVLANLPDGFEPAPRLLEFSTEARLGFYLVANGSTDSVLVQLEAGETPGNVIFSTTNSLQVSALTSDRFTLAWEDQLGVGGGDFDDLVLDVEPADPTEPPEETCRIGSQLQASTQQELIDLRSLTGQLPATYTVNREADFDNVVGLYVVENEAGTVLDPLTGQLIAPDQAGYAAAAIRQRVDLELQVQDEGTTEIQGTLDAGVILAPYILADTTPDDFLANNPENLSDSGLAYFPFLGANPDRVDHLRLLGNNSFGFEDLFGGGDMDFNDLIFTVCVTPT